MPFHYRQGRDEIDVVLEDRAGNVAAVEVKASASIRARD
jgi:predicted AAA+ superfamily ATPase